MSKIDDTARIFSTKLATILKEKNISASKLASLIEIDRASITKYLNGDSCPRVDTFLSICRELQVEPNYFLDMDYSDYSSDRSKTEERKVIESFYCLCKNNLLHIHKEDYNERKVTFNIDNYYVLDKIFLECYRFAGSEFSDDEQMCKKICDKYESKLVNSKEIKRN